MTPGKQASSSLSSSGWISVYLDMYVLGGMSAAKCLKGAVWGAVHRKVTREVTSWTGTPNNFCRG